jgi:hypothetical protein
MALKITWVLVSGRRRIHARQKDLVQVTVKFHFGLWDDFLDLGNCLVKKDIE